MPGDDDKDKKPKPHQEMEQPIVPPIDTAFITRLDTFIQYLKEHHIPILNGGDDIHAKDKTGPLKFNELGIGMKSKSPFIYSSGVSLLKFGDGFNFQVSGGVSPFLDVEHPEKYGELKAYDATTKIDLGLNYRVNGENGISFTAGPNVSYAHDNLMLNSAHSRLLHASYSGLNAGGVFAVQKDLDRNRGSVYMRGSFTYPFMNEEVNGTLAPSPLYSFHGPYSVERPGNASLTFGFRHAINNSNSPFADIGIFASVGTQLSNFNVTASKEPTPFKESFKPAEEANIGIAVRVRNHQHNGHDKGKE